MSYPPRVRILGIDPGLIITGYGCVDIRSDTAEPALVEAGVIRLKPRETLTARLAQLHADLDSILDELGPDLMVVEQLFSHYKHVRTSILMGHARGVVLLAAENRQVRIDEILPTAVKKAVTGNGHASKRQVQQAIMTQCRLREMPNPPDVADAIAIAICAARRINSREVSVPAR